MSRYSKKHYEDIARVIKESRKSDGSDYPINQYSLLDNLILLFSADNPNFDLERFLKTTK